MTAEVPHRFMLSAPTRSQSSMTATASSASKIFPICRDVLLLGGRESLKRGG